MSNPVRIAILGNSYASRIVLPALANAGANEVVCIAGRQLSKAKDTARQWNIAFATDKWQSALDLEPDLVYIATPVDLHHPMVLHAAKRTEAAILCEKPLAYDAAQAAEMASAFDGRLALINHQLRWNPVRRRMRYLLHGGAIGELWSADYEMQWSSRRTVTEPWSWWYDASRGGGVLGALGSHLVDLVRWEVGDVLAVCADLGRFQDRRPDAEGEWKAVTADEYASLWLRTESGARVSIRVGKTIAGGNGVLTHYTGHKGAMRLVGDEQLFAGQHGEALHPVEARLPTADVLNMPDRGPFARSLPLYLSAVLGAVRTGSTELRGAATFHDGLATQRILDAARTSAKRGCWIPIDD